MKKVLTRKIRGRPRAFDADKALDLGMRVFWKNGYDGTTLPDLTRAMGINRPSLYAAFGNKKSLFLKAVDLYVELGNKRVREAMALPTAREAIDAFLRGSLGACAPGKQRGCLLVQGALCGGDDSATVRRELVCRRADVETILRQRFERAITEGERLPSNDSADLARYYSTVMQGLSVQSAGNATCEQLLAVVDLAMRSWPA